MSPQVEENGRREVEEEEGDRQDGVLLHHHRDSLRPLRLHLLLPHILVDHGRSGLLCKVLPVLEKEESAVHQKTE